MSKKRGKPKKPRRKQPQRPSTKAPRAHLTTPEVAAIVEEAVAHHKAGRLVEAEDGYRRALDLDPDQPDALNLLGMIAQDTGNFEPAIELIGHAVEVSPTVAAYHLNLGNAYMAANRMAEAATAFQRTAELEPDSLAAWFNLGLARKYLGQYSQALTAFSRVLSLDPTYAPAAHLAAAVSGEHRDSAPDEYVVSLFNPYAASFDRHLEQLGYDIPHQLRDLVGESLAPDSTGLRILDLGCGTGLCGVQFRDLASHLAGCDLAPNMIAHATARQIYDQLEVQDILSALGSHEGDLDVIIAADLFIYVGALEEVFAACRRALRKGGVFTASVESSDDPGFVLRQSGRFAHSHAYMTELTAQHGMVVLGSRETTIRQEDGAPIPGRIYALGLA